jgi:hypothetical protein
MVSNEIKIERLADRLRLLVWGIIFTTAAVYLAARLGVEIANVGLVTQGALEGISASMWLARDPSAVLLLLSLWQLSQMLGLIGSGDRFSPAVTRRFRLFALCFFLGAALTFFSPLILNAVANDPADGPLRLPVKLRDLWIMIVTGVLFLVARLLDEAQRLETELEEIV